MCIPGPSLAPSATVDQVLSLGFTPSRPGAQDLGKAIWEVKGREQEVRRRRKLQACALVSRLPLSSIRPDTAGHTSEVSPSKLGINLPALIPHFSRVVPGHTNSPTLPGCPTHRQLGAGSHRQPSRCPPRLQVTSKKDQRVTGRHQKSLLKHISSSVSLPPLSHLQMKIKVVPASCIMEKRK